MAKLKPIPFDEVFPGKTREEIYAESLALKRKRLKEWYTPYDKIVEIAKSNHLDINEFELNVNRNAKNIESLCDYFDEAEKHIILGAGSLNCMRFCSEKVISTLRKKLNKGIHFELYFGDYLMTENGVNKFFDEILSNKSDVDIFYYPKERLAFHSCVVDDKINFTDIHYEFSSKRKHYSLHSKDAAEFLNNYYKTLADKYVIDRECADLIKKAEKEILLDFVLRGKLGYKLDRVPLL